MLVRFLATVLPAPAAGILIAVTVFAGGVYYRQVTGMDAIDQRLDVVDGDPAFLPAGAAPAFDAVEDRLRLIAAERPAHIYHQERRPLAEVGPGPETAGGKDRLVALRQKLLFQTRPVMVVSPMRIIREAARPFDP